jgi:hypothetical protein
LSSSLSAAAHELAALLEQRAQSLEVDAKAKRATGGQEIRAIDEDPKAVLRGYEHCCGSQNCLNARPGPRAGG